MKLRLTKVHTQRDLGRLCRQRATIPTVSLVGYTNAGKSTLFNRLTGAQVYVEDQLFATLDPTMRRLELPDVGAAILVDTVGFISHLRSEEHTSELQSRGHLVCRLLLEKKNERLNTSLCTAS